MSEHEEIWLPLVDEPIGSIVAQIQADDPEIERLVGSPRRVLAFRTFAYIRVGVKLGDGIVRGRFAGMDREGALLLDTAAGPRRIVAGELLASAA